MKRLFIKLSLVICILLSAVGCSAELAAVGNTEQEKTTEDEAPESEQAAGEVFKADTEGKTQAGTEEKTQAGTEEKTQAGTEEKTQADTEEKAQAGTEENIEADTYTFVDVFRNEYTATIDPGIPRMKYDLNRFVRDGDRLTYGRGDRIEPDSFDDTFVMSRMGVDVSHHNGDIDWEKVKQAGYDFAFIRIGYRGWGAEGTLNEDGKFNENIAGAKKAGLDVGVYFYSQAVNEKEALEEAEYVLKLLDGRELDLPVIYDPESVLDAVTGQPLPEARTYGVTGEQFTKNAVSFCNKIREFIPQSYTPGIYCNMLWEAFELDMKELEDIPVWYADYEPLPQTPYDFGFWQYSNTMKVQGIPGEVDVNVQLITMERLELDPEPFFDIYRADTGNQDIELENVNTPKAAESFRDFLTGKIGAESDDGIIYINELIRKAACTYLCTLADIYCSYTAIDADEPILCVRIGTMMQGSACYLIRQSSSTPEIFSSCEVSWCDGLEINRNGIVGMTHGQHISDHRLYWDIGAGLEVYYDDAAAEELLRTGRIKLKLDSEDGTSYTVRSCKSELDMNVCMSKEISESYPGEHIEIGSMAEMWQRISEGLDPEWGLEIDAEECCLTMKEEATWHPLSFCFVQYTGERN